MLGQIGEVQDQGSGKLMKGDNLGGPGKRWWCLDLRQEQGESIRGNKFTK